MSCLNLDFEFILIKFTEIMSCRNTVIFKYSMIQLSTLLEHFKAISFITHSDAVTGRTLESGLRVKLYFNLDARA